MRVGLLVGLALGTVVLAGCSGTATSSTPVSSRATSPAFPPAANQATSAATSPGTGASPSTAPPRQAVPRLDHVVVVVMENHTAIAVLGNPDAPFINGLARTGATLTQSYAVAHPSQPNYLALFSGSTQGVASDRCPLTFSGPNLATSLRAAGRTFAGYSEDLPSAGFTGCRAGDYARKHNPWVDFTTVPPAANQPMTRFPTDPARLPAVAFVVPNLAHDMHDGTVAEGDAWLAGHLGGYAQWARTHNSALVVTWDEDDDNHDNRIATLVVGAHVRPGPYAGRVDHYRVLRLLSDVAGARPVGRAVGAAPLTGIWDG
ncbi:alkaline phosphatase family protein [Oryzihumus sp.]